MNRVAQSALKITASAVILLIVVAGAGAGYVWYSGQNPDQNSAAFAEPGEAVHLGGIPDRPKVDENKVVSASVQSITSPVTPGSNSSIMVRTNRLATCTISVVYDKTAAKDSGLVEKKADDFGMVEWTWTVPADAPLGKWPVKVTCANKKNSAVVENDLHIVRTIE